MAQVLLNFIYPGYCTASEQVGCPPRESRLCSKGSISGAQKGLGPALLSKLSQFMLDELSLIISKLE
ncbi:unnamed protein product [Prunus armeniaca]|uniref:Uncharacterized protein n=1 Tax=Prunus armeniaca TaxID=36596 RepID=A0A6J5XRN8_PRUAR|nr:unnamed protein product [Prunus armeniaca]